MSDFECGIIYPMLRFLPPTIARLFWDVNPKKLNISFHQRTIIERVLNHGTLADWHWLVSVYGAKAIREAASSRNRLRQNGVRAESARLVEMLIK